MNKGYNLIEAAIVLAVVTLAISGLWVAASAAQEQLRSTDHAKQLIQVIQNVGTLWKGSDYSSIPAGTSLDNEMIAAGIYPTNSATNPWGGSLSVKANSSNFNIVSRLIPQKACNKIIRELAGQLRDDPRIELLMAVNSDSSDVVTLYLDTHPFVLPTNTLFCTGNTNKIWINFKP